jgi:hypothetical protein
MRRELLEVLSLLFPTKKWATLVSGRELAEFTIEKLPDYAIEERAQRALELAHELKGRAAKPQR